jgi:hypothetical protein
MPSGRFTILSGVPACGASDSGVFRWIFPMARTDDLWEELRALTPRFELKIPGLTAPVTAGFRQALESWSVYFGPDAYHFDAQGALRRACVDDFLYRSQGHTLARLRREKSQGQALLLRQDLDAPDLGTFLTEMRSRIRELKTALDGEQAIVTRSSHPPKEWQSEFRRLLVRIESADPSLSPPIANRPG